MTSVEFRGVGAGQVPSTGLRLAIFDLDRTLIAGASVAHLARSLAKARMVGPVTVGRVLVGNARFARHGEPTSSTAEKAWATALSLLAGRPAPALEAAVESAAIAVADAARPMLVALAQQHARAGDLCVIVSASPQPLVELVARHLGFAAGIGTRVEVVDGVLTGRLDGPLCHGEGKRARLRDELGPVDFARSTAYSDSANDLPLLAACGQAVVVHPDRRLAAEAERRGWLRLG